MSRNRAAMRHLLIRKLLGEQEIGSQEELLQRLAEEGHEVTQTTVSRDLATLGAVKVRTAGGDERYRLADLPPSASSSRDLAEVMRRFVLGFDHSLNLAVVRTAPGSASPVAAALDRAMLDEVAATISGDDTVLVVGRGADGGEAVATMLARILEEVR